MTQFSARIVVYLCLFFLGFMCFELQARLLEDPQIRDSRIAPLASKSMLLSIQKVQNRLFAVGERGHILVSDDKGEHWRQVKVPTKATLTDVFFISPEEGWAVGHDAIILHTKDAGETWEIQYFAPALDQPLMSVIGKPNAWNNQVELTAVGAYGTFLKSFDSGKTWQRVKVSDQDGHLNQVLGLSNGREIIAGEFGYVYQGLSDDVWHVVKTPYEGSFFGVLEPKPGHYFVFGLRGTVFYSEDGGLQWKRIPIHTTSTLLGGIVLKDGRMALVGSSGILLVADDSTNRRFNIHKFPDRKTNSDLVQLNARELLIVGEGGVKRFDLSEIGG